MPDVKKKFEFQPEHDGTLSLNSAVHQAIGAGSTCWENHSSALKDAGIFDEAYARDIANALLDFINGYDPLSSNYKESKAVPMSSVKENNNA